MTTKKKPRAKKAAQVPTIASPEARYQHGNVTIDLRVADVTTLSVDAIVNPSNERLWLGAGVSGALREACGPELQKAMSKLAPLAEGQLVTTGAFDLESIGVKAILHVSTVSGTESAVGAAYAKVLWDAGHDNIGLVALGCGVAGMHYGKSGELLGIAVGGTGGLLERHLTVCFLDTASLEAFEGGLTSALDAARALALADAPSSAVDHPLSQHTPECTYIMRQCEPDMRSRNGFVWPREGLVTCPDWNPVAECGNGLHGWLHGEGDPNTSPVWGQENAVWLVARVLTSEVVDLKGKVKVPRAWVTLAGTKDEATAEIYRLCGMKSVIAGTATAGNRGTATAGYAGTATAGDSGTATAGNSGSATAGNRGTATAGDSGTATAGYAGTATAGNSGTATAGNSGTATAGYAGTATAGYAGTATAGNRGTATAGDSGTATAGYAGTATAGDSGTATAGDSGTATAGNRGTATAGYAGTATAGDSGTATAGNSGSATAGNRGTATAGYAGTATAGDSGTATAGDSGTATAGNRGTATAGNSGTATAGYAGTATAGYAGTATAGDSGTATAGDSGTATAGNRGTATAGEDGEIRIRYWAGKRHRTVVGFIGEDGLEPNVAYVVHDGRLVRKAVQA